MIDLKRFSQEDLHRIQQLRLMDDDFMSKCFEDISCVQLVINILLERDDLTVQSVHTQHNIKNLQGRSIIMDIYATDQDGRQLNIEIQRADRGAGHKRARYHSSMLDANLLSPGDDYSKLPETYVIFITERDVLGKTFLFTTLIAALQKPENVFRMRHISYMSTVPIREKIRLVC